MHVNRTNPKTSLDNTVIRHTPDKTKNLSVYKTKGLVLTHAYTGDVWQLNAWQYMDLIKLLLKDLQCSTEAVIYLYGSDTL